MLREQLKKDNLLEFLMPKSSAADVSLLSGLCGLQARDLRRKTAVLPSAHFLQQCLSHDYSKRKTFILSTPFKIQIAIRDDAQRKKG